jgi:AcrR family transcriptional regulator
MAASSRSRPRKPRARVRLETDERRAQLLALGQAVFAERAYDEVSVDDIARAAGVSKGLLYHYFPTKRDLYVAGLREAARQLLEETLRPVGELPPLEAIRVGLDAYLGYVAGRAAAYTALFRGGIGSDPEVAAVIEETRTAYLERLLDGAAGSPALPVARDAPLVRLALSGWIGAVEASSLDWLAARAEGRETVTQTALRDYLIDLLLATVRLGAGGSASADW